MGSSQNSYRDLILFRFMVWNIANNHWFLIKTYGEWCGNFFSKMELYELWGVDVKRYDGMNCGGRYELWLGLLKVKFFYREEALGDTKPFVYCLCRWFVCFVLRLKGRTEKKIVSAIFMAVQQHWHYYWVAFALEGFFVCDDLFCMLNDCHSFLVHSIDETSHNRSRSALKCFYHYRLPNQR